MVGLYGRIASVNNAVRWGGVRRRIDFYVGDTAGILCGSLRGNVSC